MILTSMFLLGTVAVSSVSSNNEYTYTQDFGTSGRVPSDVSPTSVRSRTECAALCSLESRCGGFYFSRPQQECFLELDTVFTNFKVNDAGLHYTKDAPVDTGPTTTTTSTSTSSPSPPPTTTIPSTITTIPSPPLPTTTSQEPPITKAITLPPTTTATLPTTQPPPTTIPPPPPTTTATPSTTTTQPPPPVTTTTTTTTTTHPPRPPSTTTTATLNCSPTFTEWNVTGTSGLNYSFKISDDTVNQGEAVNRCAGCGLQLLQLNDVAKFEALNTFLVASDRWLQQYWTDAIRFTSEVGMPWKNAAGGNELPTSVWCNGSPGTDADKNCARLTQYYGCGYYLKNEACTSNLGAICE